MNPVRRILWLYCFLALLAWPLLAAEYSGRVVGVQDGDPLTLLVPDGTRFKQVKVRLVDQRAGKPPALRQPRPTGAVRSGL